MDGKPFSDLSTYVIIPLYKNGGFSQKALHFFITVVVLPVHSELIQSDGNKVQTGIVGPISTSHGLGNFFDRRNSTISIYHITLEERKVGVKAFHNLKDDISPCDGFPVRGGNGKIGIPSPALTSQIGHPDETEGN